MNDDGRFNLDILTRRNPILIYDDREPINIMGQMLVHFMVSQGEIKNSPLKDIKFKQDISYDKKE